MLFSVQSQLRFLVLGVAAAGLSSSSLGQVIENPVDPAQGAFPNAEFYLFDPAGPIGGPADVSVEATFAADENGVLDVFVLFGDSRITGGDFTYSSSMTWENPASSPRYREWVGNFFDLPEPVAANITDTDSDPSPVTFTDTSASVGPRFFAELPPFPIERYHAQISGLQPGESVVFTKTATGGTVTPEPSSLLLVLTAAVMTLYARRRW